MFQASVTQKDWFEEFTRLRGFVAVRWLILVVYVSLAPSVFHVDGVALALSTTALCAYQSLYTWQRLSTQSQRWFRTFAPYIDVAMTSITLVAVADVESPIWAIYFISILAVAHVMTPREMYGYVAFTIASYACAAMGILALGNSVSGAYVAVVCVLLFFMGLNSTLLSAGEQRLRKLIAHVAVTDSLTGLPNRRHFQELYRHAIGAAAEHRTPLTLMLVDVDHFKLINDTHGHPAGDEKLRDVAHAFSEVMRRSDVVARYGGDEFIVIATETDLGDGMNLAERLRAAASACGIGVSIGVAVFPEDGGTADRLTEAADRALYAAKEAGRDCIRAAA